MKYVLIAISLLMFPAFSFADWDPAAAQPGTVKFCLKNDSTERQEKSFTFPMSGQHVNLGIQAAPSEQRPTIGETFLRITDARLNLDVTSLNSECYAGYAGGDSRANIVTLVIHNNGTCCISTRDTDATSNALPAPQVYACNFDESAMGCTGD